MIVFSTPEGKGLVITFWESKEAARSTEGDEGFYTEVISSFMTVFTAPPGRDHYELVFSDLPALSTG